MHYTLISQSKSCEAMRIFHRLIQKSNNTTDVTFLKWPAGAYWWANEQRKAIVPTKWPANEQLVGGWFASASILKTKRKATRWSWSDLWWKRRVLLLNDDFWKKYSNPVVLVQPPSKNGGFEDSFRYPASFQGLWMVAVCGILTGELTVDKMFAEGWCNSFCVSSSSRKMLEHTRNESSFGQAMFHGLWFLGSR